MKPMTLCRYVKQAKQFGATGGLSFGHNGHQAVFDKSQETVLAKYLRTAANIYFGLSQKDVRILAYECASAFKKQCQSRGRKTSVQVLTGLHPLLNAMGTCR